jgi:hypothetical protein
MTQSTQGGDDSFKNIQKLAKMLDGHQLVSMEEFRSAVSDFINAFAQHRSAFGEISKKNEESMSTALRNLQAEFETIRLDVKNETGMTKEEMKSALSKCMADMKDMCDEMIAMKPLDGKDADEERIIQEVLSKIKLPEQKEIILDTPDEVVDKVNNSKKQIKKERVEGLEQAIMNSASNAVNALPVTTTLVNGKRAKNLNITGATVNVVGDTANVVITTGSGTGDVVGPASATDSNFASFDTTTGKLLKDSGVSTASFAPALGADDNYVTDAEKVVIGNTSGTNTGDQTSVSGNAGSATTTGITDDTTTNATMYPTWVTAVTGNLAQKVSSTKLFFNSLSGLLSSTAHAIIGTAGGGFLTFVAQSVNPTAPAAGTVLIHAATTNGFTRLEQDNEATTNLVICRDIAPIAKNTSGGTITKGSPVYITGSTGNVSNIAKAQANSSTTLPATFVVVDDIADNAFGQVMMKGVISGFDTSAFTSGDRLWVSPTVAGGLTNTRPSGTTNFVQRIGSVQVSGVGNGSILVDIAPAVQNMETGTNAATFTGSAFVGTTYSASGQITSTVSTGTAPLVIASTTKVSNLHVDRATLADTVTTNANLTGPVTSVGNATAIADAALSIAKTSGLQTALDAKAPLASPTFTGTVTLPVALTGVIRTDSGVVSVDSDVTDIVSASSLTVAGKVELATTAEIDTGTDSTRAMPVDQFVASNRNVRYILFRVLDKATDWSADGTTAVGGDLVIPFTGTIVDIEADVDTAGTTGTSIVDVNKGGTTIMTTNKLKWDSTEKSTRTYSGTAPGLTTTAVTAGDIITVDIDTNHTTKSKGLTLFLAIRLT